VASHILGFESVYIDKGSHELCAGAPRAIDLAPDGSQPGAPAAYSCQLVGPGIFTVLGGLCATPCGSVEITRRVVMRVGLSVTQLGRDVTILRGQIAFATVDVALARSCKCISVCPRGPAVLIWPSHAVGRPSYDRWAPSNADINCLLLRYVDSGIFGRQLVGSTGLVPIL
jgi:hypothetical protein